MGKISLTSSIVINVLTRASLAVKTKVLLFLWLVNLNNKSNVCKQVSSLYTLNIPDKIKEIRTFILGLISLFFSCRFIRTVGYRWIIHWLCGYMGWGNTRPLPACIYQNIRTRYATPHRQLTGYRND